MENSYRKGARGNKFWRAVKIVYLRLIFDQDRGYPATAVRHQPLGRVGARDRNTGLHHDRVLNKVAEVPQYQDDQKGKQGAILHHPAWGRPQDFLYFFASNFEVFVLLHELILVSEKRLAQIERNHLPAFCPEAPV
mgnify:CR=1 FL=1